ncbi:hypothetical protein B0H13DRAFT_2325208 [Mycena leptocephala]|nr:hypothetical protein B0H13DRAFT_2325208 [Mycena leptocephala]
MAPKPQAAPKQKKSGGQGSRKAAPKNPRKVATAVMDDDFQGETIEVSDPRATVWTFFDNDACRRFVPLFNEDVIDNTPAKMVASILRDALPSFQSYYHKKPSLHPEHIAFLYAASHAAQFAIEAHPKHVKEQEFAEIVNVYSSRVKDLRRKQGIAAALPGFIIPRIAEPPGGSGFTASDDEMDEVLSVQDAESESFIGDQNEDDEEEEVPAPKRLRREVAALQSSPPPVASSSKPRPAASPVKTQPVASSSKIPPPKMDVPYVVIPSSEHKRKRDPPVSTYRLQPLPSPPPAPAYAPPAPSAIPETPHTLRLDMLHEMPLCPPGEWVRFNAQPLPATQLVPTSFVQDGLVPALYSKAPFKCHTCIVLNKLCHSCSMNIPCEECNSSKHKCSIVASPVRFLQNLEELHPMMNLGPEVLSRALLNTIELRRECDLVYAQLVHLTHRFELSLDEVLLRFSNMDDVLPEDYVRFGFENPADVDLLRTLSNQLRSTRLPHPDLEMQHLENHPTTDVLSRHAPGDPTTTNNYYMATAPPLLAEAPTLDDLPAIASHIVPAAFSQLHALPETYAVNPLSQAPSNASVTAPQITTVANLAPPSASAAHSMSTRPFGGAGSLLQPGVTPAPWNQPPASPGQGAAGPSGSGV